MRDCYIKNIRWPIFSHTFVNERGRVCTHAPSREPKRADLKTRVPGRACYYNQQACSSTAVSVNLHLLTGNTESWLFVHFLSSVRPHQSICRAHQPALIARLHMIPRIRLLRLMYSRFIWRVANIAFITVSTKKSALNGLDSSNITAGKYKKGFSFISMFNNSTLSHYAPITEIRAQRNRH